MVRKKDKQRMKDYLVAKLEKEYPKLDVRTEQLISPIKSTYMFTYPNSDNVVFLLDQEYPSGNFNKIFNRFQKNGVNLTPVFFKDGETFFRNAAERHYFKMDKDLSLKNYSKGEMNRMILFRPEEIFVNSMKKYLQYYQPESSRLEEGIETFEFKPVYFDYSHLGKDRFRPTEKNSERLHIWTKRRHQPGDLKIHKAGYLVRKD